MSNSIYDEISHDSSLSSIHQDSPVKGRSRVLSESTITTLFKSMITSEINNLQKFQAETSMKEIQKFECQQICYLCNQVFDKTALIFRHHCRNCLKSVCGLCSKKNSSNTRECDLCQFKVKFQKQMDRQNAFLNIKDDTIQKLNDTINQKQEQIQKNDDDIKQTLLNIEKDKKIQLDELNINIQIDQELDQQIINLTNEENSLKNQNKIDQEILFNFKKQLQDIKISIKTLKFDISSKEKIVEQREQQKIEVLRQEKQMEISESFVNLCKQWPTIKNNLTPSDIFLSIHQKQNSQTNSLLFSQKSMVNPQSSQQQKKCNIF